MTVKFPFRSTIILTIVAVLAVVVPLLLMNAGIIDPFTTRILTIGGVNAIMAISVNMIVGVTGQLSLGQAGFMAIGAYSCIFFNLDMGLPLPVAAVCAALVTALAGFLIGFPVLKFSGDYLAIVTLGFGEIIRVVFNSLRNLTGGPDGRQLFTEIFFNRELAFVVTITVLIVVLSLLMNFLRSSYGRAIMACREDEIAANACGINTFRYRMIGFVIAAFIAGIGGALFAMVNGQVSPAIAQFIRSVDYLIFVVLGGMGSMTGSILAAFTLTYLQEMLRFLQDYRLLIYPLILILFMMFRPKGILGMREFSVVGFVDKIRDKIFRRRQKLEVKP